MTDLEIPLGKAVTARYRFFEILPGVVSWSLLVLPFALSLINVTIAAIFVLAYLLINFMRGMAGAVRALQGYNVMRQHCRMDWQTFLADLEAGKVVIAGAHRPKWHRAALERLSSEPLTIKPNEVIHAIIIATVREAREVLEPTIQAVLDSDYDMRQVILILAYEERGGEKTEAQAKALIREYGSRFKHAMAVRHPRNLPNEVIGKGGNINYAGRELLRYVEKEKIDPNRVVVTTLDADNHIDKKYLAALSYIYVLTPDRIRASFQPVTIYNNNTWDAPALTRVVASGNSLYNIVLSLRLHALRNFSAHAQPLSGLIKTGFWSGRTIVEDGHQFWRSYFAFDGNYQVYPLFVPIYQDAVMTKGYVKTLKAQFIQLRRWTWGASDVAYVVNQGFFKKNKVPRLNLIAKLWQLLEGHVTWATAPLLTLGAGFLPALFHPQSFAANELPLIVSRIQTVAVIVGVLTTIFIFLKTLPPKPDRYKHYRSLFMLIQWIYLPVTTIVYNSLAALYSQTRLILNKRLSFIETEKAVVTEDNKVIL